MKRVFTILAAIILVAGVFAQSPEKMSYQAVIRNSSNALVTNQAVGMRISILQGSPTGTVVYTETQKPTTNANGLVSIEIGGGAGFSAIDWANDTYFIKTETDPTGGTNYTITGTSQLLSVPYALHAKTAESLSGDIAETDPTFTGSQAANITATDIAKLGNLSGINTGDQDLSALATKTALGDSTAKVRSEIPDVSGFLTTYTETDPDFGASVAKGITATDTTNWNNKQDHLTAGSGISIVGSTISVSSSRPTYSIGLNPQLGGYVFYVTPNGKHGLVCETSDRNRSVRSYYAMDIDPSRGGNFTDWRLPTLKELTLMCEQMNEIGGFELHKDYWSSVLYFTGGWGDNYTEVWAYYFDEWGGFTGTQSYDFQANVRMVRSF